MEKRGEQEKLRKKLFFFEILRVKDTAGLIQ